MRGVRLKLRVLPEEFVAHLADAICRVFVDHGFEGSIDDLKSDLKKAFQEVIEKGSRRSSRTAPSGRPMTDEDNTHH